MTCAVCARCWPAFALGLGKQPARWPIEGMGPREACAACGHVTQAGVYVRIDKALVEQWAAIRGETPDPPEVATLREQVDRLTAQHRAAHLALSREAGTVEALRRSTRLLERDNERLRGGGR